VSVTIVKQHAKRTRHITYSFVSCLVVPYYSTLTRMRQNFEKKKIIIHKMRVVIFF